MAPAVGHVLPVAGEDLHRLGGLIEGDAQGAGDVAGEKGPAVPGVEQHEHPPSVLHLVLDGVDFDLAKKLGFVVGLETRQLLGRRFHARTSWLSMEPFSPHLPPTDIDPARSVARVYRDDGTERIVTADPAFRAAWRASADPGRKPGDPRNPPCVSPLSRRKRGQGVRTVSRSQSPKNTRARGWTALLCCAGGCVKPTPT